MSEAGFTAGGEPSAGSLLRQAREAAGLHLDTLAANLKVPPRKLEALEQDRYDLLPDAVFVRALASSVCRTLKIDAQPVLERLPQGAQPRLAQDRDGINAPFRPPGHGAGGGWVGHLTRPVGLTVLALLLAAVVLVFLPVAQRGDFALPAGETPIAVAPETAPVTLAEPVQPLPAPTPPVEAVVPPAEPPATLAATTPAAPATPVGSPTAEAALPAASAAGPVPTPPAGLAPSPPGAVVPGTQAPEPTPAGLLSFRASGESWIRVTDATGATVMQRLLQAGETATASGALPLSVTVGNSAGTEVLVRGKPYNLGTVARDNVARFEVK